jgi:oxidase EvaA
VLHCLMQAKAEPGNCNGVQLSPTVQATRSNYTRVHGGKPVPYLEYFQDTLRHNVIADVRQSEQGSWFQHKRNRNMAVEVTEDVELLDGFCWLTLGQVHRLFRVDNLITMDARTVLSCLPFAGVDLAKVFSPDVDEFTAALIRSCDEDEGSLHSTDGVLSWVTESRTRTDVYTGRIPLREVRGWHRTDEKISHERGLYFDVIGLNVTAGGREVNSWTQPVIEPHGVGVVAFLAQVIGGVMHVLVHARAEPGFIDAIELAPTVQCIPENFDPLPAEARPLFLDYVLNAKPDQIRFDTELSEEGGRFYHARNRYLVIETDMAADAAHPDFRWMAVHQLVDLLRHSHYLNVQARSLVACLHSLSGG